MTQTQHLFFPDSNMLPECKANCNRKPVFHYKRSLCVAKKNLTRKESVSNSTDSRPNDPIVEKKYESKRELSPSSNMLELVNSDEILEHLLSSLCQRFFPSVCALGPVCSLHTPGKQASFVLSPLSSLFNLSPFPQPIFLGNNVLPWLPASCVFFSVWYCAWEGVDTHIFEGCWKK